MPADTRNSDRLYYVLLPDGEILEITSRRPDIITGDEIFEEACRRIELVEKDFFSLRHREYPHQPERWVNLKNVLQIEIGSKPPNLPHRTFYRFSLQIKFYAPPYMLLTSKCKHLFYLAEKKKFLENRFSLSLQDTVEIATALSRVECDSKLSKVQDYSQFVPKSTKYKRLVLESHVAYNHEEGIKRNEGTLRSDLVVGLLTKLYNYDEYGRHWYESLLFSMGDIELKGSLAIGISEVAITDAAGDEFYKFPLNDVTKVQKSITGEFTILLKEAQDYLVHKTISILSLEQECSTEMYRLMAETVCFYLFDKVTPEFRNKLLPASSSSGNQIFLYDIKMTICEAFCHYSTQILDVSSDHLSFALKLTDRMKDGSSELISTGVATCKVESLRCKICLSSPIEVVFKECGHAACCLECWFCNISSCPICRAPLYWYTAKPMLCTLNSN